MYNRGRLLLLFLLILLRSPLVQAAWYSFVPASAGLPDGSVLQFFLTGDEFHHWTHDVEGYTLLRAEDGYYYYAEYSTGVLKPGIHRAGTIDPAEIGLSPWMTFPESDQMPGKPNQPASGSLFATAPFSGLLNNLVIYIRFSDEAEFTTTRQGFDELFNDMDGPSLKSYYSEVSYNQLNITSSHYPACASTANRSYQDNHPRNYYLPYQPVSNPVGYGSVDERISREHTLIKNAIEWIIINSPVPSTMNLDHDNDGRVDNVCFVISGSGNTWSELLWSHAWQLFSHTVMLNGKQVWGYNFYPENQADVRTICHEMFHSLGAPDLYHYAANGVQPTACWDIMESGSGHMNAWMKHRYSGKNWIGSIPEISRSGTYSLNPITAGTGQCFKVASPNSSTEFFILEYRKQEGFFESSLPGAGLLIYRVDTMYQGNTAGPPDEVYLYRPNGTPGTNGSPANAFFSQESGRTAINDGTNPSCFLQQGQAGGLQIYDIGTCGATITFTIHLNEIPAPSGFNAATPACGQVKLEWDANQDNNPVLLVHSMINTFGIPVDGNLFPVGTQLPGGGEIIYFGNSEEFLHTGLGNHEGNFYRIYSVAEGYRYSNSSFQSAVTLCGSYQLPFMLDFNSGEMPDCAYLQHEGENVIDNWDVSATTFTGGNGYELRSTFQQAGNAVSRFVLPALDTRGMASLNLCFRHTLDDWAPGTMFRIETSHDGLNWTPEAWSMASASNTMRGPVEVTTPVVNHLNRSTTYLAFTVAGNLYQYDFWYIDDIHIKASEMVNVEVLVNSSPTEGGATTGAGDYSYGEPVTLGADPSSGWNFLYWLENGEIVSSESEYSFPAKDRILTANFSTSEVFLGLSCEPACGGTAHGSGVYPKGAFVSAIAYPEAGYDFIGWKKDGSIVSTEVAYAFTIQATTNLIAVFAARVLDQYSISVSAEPVEGGIVLGGGTLAEHTLATIFAIPYAGWVFDSWRENGSVVSFQPGFSFVVTGNHSFDAVFRQVVTISAGAFPETAGFTSGTGDFLSGEPVTVTAHANPDWTFTRWLLNGEEVSTSHTYTFVASSECSLLAVFSTGVGGSEPDLSSVYLFPNPCKDFTTIFNSGNERFSTVSIINTEGKPVYHSDLNTCSQSIPVDVSGLTPGIYFVRMGVKAGILGRRLVVR